MVCDRPEVGCAKALAPSRHCRVSSCLPFLPFKTENTSYLWIPGGQHRAKDILGSCESIMHPKSSGQKCTRAPLKIYMDIPQYPNSHHQNPKAWTILISVPISPSHSKLRISLWNSGTQKIWIIASSPLLSNLSLLHLTIWTQFAVFSQYFESPTMFYVSIIKWHK